MSYLVSTPDGSQSWTGYDTAHFSNDVDSILNYAQELIVNPTALDIAYLDDLGYEVTTPEIAKSNEIYSLGAWAESSMFSLTVARDLDDDPYLYATEPQLDKVRASASAIGLEPHTSFTAAHQGLTGNAIYEGILIGADLGAEGLPLVTGDSTITIDLSEFSGQAQFTDLKTWSSGSPIPFRAGKLTYDVSVVGNRFEDMNRRVSGTWYGTGHNELAGTLLDDRVSVNLTAAFGAKR